MSDENGSRATRDIASLRDALQEIVDLVAGVLTAGGTAPPDDHMAFMAYVFLSKQLDHAIGILRLDDHPDTQLIARSMLEGRCQLLWAYADPEPRALLWREFVLIVDWRTLRAQDAKDETVDPETRATVVRRVAESGEQFRKRSSATSDPYRREWHPLGSVREMFRETDSMRLYDELYGPLSEWHHWSPGGAGRAITHTDGSFVYRAQDDAMHATALAAAFQCLHDTTGVADRVLNIGIGTQLADVSRRYIARFDRSPRALRADDADSAP